MYCLLVFSFDFAFGNVIFITLGLASVDIIGVQKSRSDSITSGDSETLTLSASGISSGEEILIVPIVLGELGEYKKAYTCEEDFGISVKLA